MYIASHGGLRCRRVITARLPGTYTYTRMYVFSGSLAINHSPLFKARDSRAAMRV